MSDVGVVDQFLQVFSRYIDSGFGLVRGDVASLARLLVALDVTLAALFWAWGAGDELFARLVKKVLYVGAFAFILSDFQGLAQVVFDSFAGLGLKAAGAGLSAADLLHPGKIAGAGIDAVRPLLAAAGDLAGFPAIFENFVQIAVLLGCVGVVLIAFFVLAVQLFVVLIEFKLTTLAGFVLAPFGLFGRTAFLAERVLGNVMASGVKVLVLAIIVGIGSTLFQGFVGDYAAAQPTLDQVLATALGALCLLGLGMFGPGIAGGLVSGAPQLGAGAAVGTGLAVGGLAVAGVAGARAAAGAGAALQGSRTVQALAAGGAWPPGGGSDAAGGRPSTGPSGGPGSAGGGPTSAGGAVVSSAGGPAASGDQQGPEWARRFRAAEQLTGGVTAAAHALRASDGPGGSTAVPLDQESP